MAVEHKYNNSCTQISTVLTDKSIPYFYKYPFKHGIPAEAARAGNEGCWEADGPQPLPQRPFLALPPRRLLPHQLPPRTLQRPALARKLGAVHQVVILVSLSQPFSGHFCPLMLIPPSSFLLFSLPGCSALGLATVPGWFWPASPSVSRSSSSPRRSSAVHWVLISFPD